MQISEELEKLRRERVEGMPFNSLIEFEQWADIVSPLLSFDSELKDSFCQSVTSAKVAHRLDDMVDAATNMNECIGLLNQATISAKKYEHEQYSETTAELSPPQKITIAWLLKHVEIKHWFSVAALLASIFTAGVATSEIGVYKNITRLITPKETNYVRAAGALIVGCNNKKPSMLGVLHNEGGSFVFSPPAGKAKPGESEKATAIRETKEETGYSIITGKSLGNSPKGNTKFSLVLAEVDSSSPADSHYQEAVGLLWANPKNIPISGWRFPEQREWIIELFEENAPGECP